MATAVPAGAVEIELATLAGGQGQCADGTGAVVGGAGHAVAGGEPDPALPVRGDPGDGVAVGHRAGQRQAAVDGQCPGAGGGAVVPDPQQPALAVDGHQAVVLVQVGVDAAEQRALGERQFGERAAVRRVEQVDGRGEAEDGGAERDGVAVRADQHGRAGGLQGHPVGGERSGLRPGQRGGVRGAGVAVHGGGAVRSRVRVVRRQRRVRGVGAGRGGARQEEGGGEHGGARRQGEAHGLSSHSGEWRGGPRTAVRTTRRVPGGLPGGSPRWSERAATDRGACVGQVDVESTAQVRMAGHPASLPG